MDNEGILFSGDTVPVPGDLPVYEDVMASVQSLKILQNLTGIRIILPAWDQPGEGKEAYIRIDRAAQYLQRIHETVRSGSGKGITDLMEQTRYIADVIGLPSGVVSPVLARSIAAHMRVLDQVNLLMEYQ
jgi:hypothetical protein